VGGKEGVSPLKNIIVFFFLPTGSENGTNISNIFLDGQASLSTFSSSTTTATTTTGTVQK
jgi:hypothetical protein